MNDSSILLPDGRKLAFIDMGESKAPCVLFFHGAPSSRLRISYLEEEVVANGLRVVSLDRPGYGGSSPQPGRRLSDWPVDVERLMHHLGVDEFLVAGHSSGGPYALACAAHFPDHVSGALVFGGVTDMGWEGAWAGFVRSEVELMRLPDERSVIAECDARYGADGSGFLSTSGFELSEPDERLYSEPRIAEQLIRARDEAFRQGILGYAQDVFVQGQPWPFEPVEISVPTYVFHGEHDDLLPVAHSRHTSELIPNASLHVLPDHGHFSVLSELPGLAASLIDQDDEN